MAYNVTAVEQSDPSSNAGPAYLLNGISDTGYWYQVGLSWNWNPGYYPGTGFDMVYDIFSPNGISIFPISGGGGLLSFSGPVHSGDTVLLNLYFSNQSGVVLLARDYNTGASASETYSAEGATYFSGNPSSTTNSNGFFTGLMTEWYHSSAFYGNILPVTYSNPNYALSSAWMWMDEFTCSDISCSKSTILFSDNTLEPVSYSNLTQLQGFSSHGATEFSDAYELVTGPAYLLLTISYAVEGGGTGYDAPTLTYSINGMTESVTLTQSPVTYNVDADGRWSTSASLGGSTQGERWATNQSSSGIVSSDETVQVAYYHQFALTVSYSVTGGGSPSPPAVTGTQFGSPVLIATQTQGGAVWLDSGSTWSIGNDLGGSNSQEIWASSSAPSGSMDSASSVSVTYYHQYALTLGYSVAGGGSATGPSMSGEQFGQPFSATLGETPSTYFLDSGSTWTVPNLLAGSSSTERWQLTQSESNLVTGPSTVNLTYDHQYYATTTFAPSDGGSASNTTGWYTAGATMELTASANAGWQFEGWSGSGEGAYSGQLNQTSVHVNGPITEGATFYPGLVITSGGNGAVGYSIGAHTGTVQAGGPLTIYAPAGTIVDLSATPSSLLFQFSAWTPSSLGNSGQASVVLQSPTSVAATFSLNLLTIGGIIAAIVAVASVSVVALRRRAARYFPMPATDKPALAVDGLAREPAFQHR